MAFFTSDWNPLGKNIYYRKNEIYNMEWGDKINLSDFIIAGAQCGGPLALMRDEKKIQKALGSGKPTIYIFSASGQTIHNIKWNSGRLLFLAWSTSEELICVQDDGVILLYDIVGSPPNHFTMGNKEHKVLDCRSFISNQNTGIAILTESYQFFYTNSILDPRTHAMPIVPGLTFPPSSWVVFSDHNSTKIIVAKASKEVVELFVLDGNDRTCFEKKPEFSKKISSIIEIAVSPNNQNLALFSNLGTIWFGRTNFKEKYSEFDTGCKQRPLQFIWCGNQAVLCYWSNQLLVVGLEKDYINFHFESPIYLISEIDGARVITNTTHELLQKVPAVVTEIFRIGSVAPGALLLEASKEYQKRSHKADDYMSMIRASNHLEIAVNQCIQAAGYEWMPSFQKMLLRAASFGKCFSPHLNPDAFVKMCQVLRVLNAVRMYQIGLPITYTQLEYLTLPVLLDRLVLRRHYFLAIKITQFMKIPVTEGASRILAHWACYKVKQEWDGEKAAIEIAQKLGDTPGISYSEIANKAVDNGKMKLAIHLLDYEPRASQQVPLLIKLGQEKQAMRKAIESGDTDLVYMVIKFLEKKYRFSEFLQAVNEVPVAYSLYLKLCKDQSLQKLKDAYESKDNLISQADCSVMESYNTKIPERQIASLEEAAKKYKNGRNDFAGQQTDDQIRLLKYQLRLKEKLNQPYTNLSVSGTLKQLVCDKQFKLAEDFHKEFKVPDRRYWWIKVMALAEIKEWLELDKFSKSRKSPIGYEPFVDVCLKHNNQFEAKKYLSRIKEDSKVAYYAKTGLLEEAAKLAFDLKDENGLNLVLSKCGTGNKVLAERIVSLKAQLKH